MKCWVIGISALLAVASALTVWLYVGSDHRRPATLAEAVLATCPADPRAMPRQASAPPLRFNPRDIGVPASLQPVYDSLARRGDVLVVWKDRSQGSRWIASVRRLGFASYETEACKVTHAWWYDSRLRH